MKILRRVCALLIATGSRRTALAKYQSAEKLSVTGNLDAETTARLDVHQRLFRPRGVRSGGLERPTRRLQ
jgi:hypothetical protein